MATTRARPWIYTFTQGDRFDLDADRKKINHNFLAMQAKFGTLYSSDFSNLTTVKFNGSIDMRSHEVSNVSEHMGVVNLKDNGVSLVALMANMTTGGIIFIPPGHTEVIKSPVKFLDDVQIVGGGWTSVIEITRPTGAGFNMLLISNVQNCAVRNLRIKGNLDTKTGTTRGIFLKSHTNLQAEVENVLIGPEYNGGTSWAVDGPAIEAHTCGMIRISGCTLRRNAIGYRGGSGGTQARAVDIHDTVIEQSQTYGILDTDSDNLMISGCTIRENNSTGIWSKQNKPLHIFGCNFGHNTTHCVKVGGSVGTKNEAIVIGNTFQDDLPTATTTSHFVVDTNVSHLVMYGNDLGRQNSGGRKLVLPASAAARPIQARDGNNIHTFNYPTAAEIEAAGMGPFGAFSWRDKEGAEEIGGSMGASMRDASMDAKGFAPSTSISQMWLIDNSLTTLPEHFVLPDQGQFQEFFGNQGTPMAPTYLNADDPADIEEEYLSINLTRNYVNPQPTRWCESFPPGFDTLTRPLVREACNGLNYARLTNNITNRGDRFQVGMAWFGPTASNGRIWITYAEYLATGTTSNFPPGPNAGAGRQRYHMPSWVTVRG